jgi:hypothetical protein
VIALDFLSQISEMREADAEVGGLSAVTFVGFAVLFGAERFQLLEDFGSGHDFVHYYTVGARKVFDFDSGGLKIELQTFLSAKGDNHVLHPQNGRFAGGVFFARQCARYAWIDRGTRNGLDGRQPDERGSSDHEHGHRCGGGIPNQ